MKRQLISLVAALVTMLVLTPGMFAYAADKAPAPAIVVDPAEAAAIAATGKQAPGPEASVAAVVNPQTAVACQMCFTCGGDWPIFAGAIHAVNTGLLTFERGSSCSGTLHSANDANPFLCCR